MDVAHASMASQSISCYFSLYLVVALQNEVLEWSQTWIGMFQNHLTVSSDNTHSVKAGNLLNKKKKKKKKMEKWAYFTISQNL